MAPTFMFILCPLPFWNIVMYFTPSAKNVPKQSTRETRIWRGTCSSTCCILFQQHGLKIIYCVKICQSKLVWHSVWFPGMVSQFFKKSQTMNHGIKHKWRSVPWEQQLNVGESVLSYVQTGQAMAFVAPRKSKGSQVQEPISADIGQRQGTPWTETTYLWPI